LQMKRIQLLLATVCCVVVALALLTPSHLGFFSLASNLNIINRTKSQSLAKTNSNEIGGDLNDAAIGDSAQVGGVPSPPFDSPQLEEESRRQRIQSSAETSVPPPTFFASPTSTSTTTSTTIPFDCSVRVIQTNSVVPIYYRVEIFVADGRAVFAKISHDDDVEIIDIAIINGRGSALVKSFSRKIPTVDVFSRDSNMKTQLGCRT